MMRCPSQLVVLLLLVLGCDPQAATGLSDASLDATDGRSDAEVRSSLDAFEEVRRDDSAFDAVQEAQRFDALDDERAEGDARMGDGGVDAVQDDRGDAAMDALPSVDADALTDAAVDVASDGLAPLPAVYATTNVRVRRIFADNGGTLATAEDGSLWSWGSNGNSNMQPSDGPPIPGDRRLRPQRIDGVRDVREVEGDCVLSGPESGGSIYCWGWSALNSYGGPEGAWAEWRLPRRMGTFNDVLGFFWDTYSVRADRTLWRHRRSDELWERSSSYAGEVLPTPTDGLYQVTDGVVATSYADIVPYFEPGRYRIPGITQVAGSRVHMCMLLTTGRVMCWGRNTAGESGNFELGGRCGADGRGPGDCVRRPTEVPDLTDVVQIAAGGFRTCALKRDGTVWCWGYNGTLIDGLGLIGDGRPAAGETCGFNVDRVLECRRRPTRIAGITRAVHISVGVDFQCAALADGEALCWGNNDYGELGDGTTTERSLPTPVRWL